MYLKSLTLKGFKSFAEPATLHLEPGVTVVVGPNGSGKSNVVDGIAWVLGAQAPTAVRSQKMEDVIFAGTDARAALGRAEVSLVIDNTSGQIPIEFTEVTLTRTLFRNGDSEYALNGVPCRLLDITELLSDSGVGRQQHVIISQGQIDAVLNARPEDRRSIIEEAAGVLKYRKRRERSERRLEATEANLTRLADLLREVRRQLRPLERQAEAARRHGDLLAELTALRVHTSGRELAGLRTSLDEVGRRRIELDQANTELTKSLAELDAQVMGCESELSTLGGTDLGDDLATVESLHERARGLASLLAERQRSLARERQATVDEAVIATLEAEVTHLREELDRVEVELAELEPQRQALAAAEAELAEARVAFEQQWAEGVEAPSGRAAEVRGELGARRGALERNGAEQERLAQRIASLVSKAERLETEAERLRRELRAAEGDELPLVASMDTAEREVVAGEAAVSASAEELRLAETEQRSWSARAEALALALDEARSAAGAERLAGRDGVLGALVELIEIDPGWESAVAAACAGALDVVVVSSPEAARQALDALAGDDLAGAVVAVGSAAPVQTALPPALGHPVRHHVRAADPSVEPLLDALFANAFVVEGGWQPALDVALSTPGVTVVTPSGDRFAPDGWRLGAGASRATRAALDEARQRATDATASAEVARRRNEEAVLRLEEAKRAVRELTRDLDANDGRLSAAGDALQRVETERRDAQTEIETLQAHESELAGRLARDRGEVTRLEAELPVLEAAEAETIERGRAVGRARTELEERAAQVGADRTDLGAREAGLAERQEFLRRRIGEIDERLAGHVTERAAFAARRRQLEEAATALDRLAAFVAGRIAEVSGVLEELRASRRRQSDAVRSVTSQLDTLRRQRHQGEQALTELREQLRRNELEDAELRLRIETACDAIRRDLDCEPDVAVAAPCPELPEGSTPAGHLRELERELRIMGPINPLALAEFDELSERHTFLAGQLDDVKQSRRELHKIIRAIDAEIVTVFASAFADVSQNFEHLFATLFPGGTGRLRLTDPDDLLRTGIEVEAKPSGKNVKKLSLLSGGERSLTALAFLFAVFRSRPSPFYVMDEVEAALDDINLHRFLDLVEEFRHDAQLVIVSHQKRTMEAADCLYGVSMQPGGSSKVVSERTAVAEPVG